MGTIFEKIEILADDTRKKLGYTELPLPVEDLAKRLQIKISKAPSADFSGILIRKDGKALIGINSSEAQVRQRFTIAHELGHFILHPQKDAFVDYRDNKKDAMRTAKERQANMFAAALLMPKAELINDLKAIAKSGFTEDELGILAERYMVSEDSMRFRLMNLHLLTLS